VHRSLGVVTQGAMNGGVTQLSKRKSKFLDSHLEKRAKKFETPLANYLLRKGGKKLLI